MSGLNNPLNSKNNQFNTNNPANAALNSTSSTASGPQCDFHQSMSPTNNTIKKTNQNGIKPEDCYE
jgi:hypothetical protein